MRGGQDVSVVFSLRWDKCGTVWREEVVAFMGFYGANSVRLQSPPWIC